MRYRQIALPFCGRPGNRRLHQNDLIGRTYKEDYATVTVIGLCLHDESRVMLRRDPSGSTWSMPAWLVRLIFMEQKRKAIKRQPADLPHIQVRAHAGRAG